MKRPGLLKALLLVAVVTVVLPATLTAAPSKENLRSGKGGGVGVEPTDRWATPVSPVLKVCYERSI